MSRPVLSMLILFMCRVLKIPVATCKQFVMTETSYFQCRDPFFLLRPNPLLQPFFCLDKFFHVTVISVTTEDGSVVTDFCFLFSIMSQHPFSLSQLTCYVLTILCHDLLSSVATTLICQHSDFCVATQKIFDSCHSRLS